MNLTRCTCNMFYFGKNDSWYERDIEIEKYLVLNYEIMPSQVILSVNLFYTRLVLFRTKFENKVKLLKINNNGRSTKITKK